MSADLFLHSAPTTGTDAVNGSGQGDAARVREDGRQPASAEYLAGKHRTGGISPPPDPKFSGARQRALGTLRWRPVLTRGDDSVLRALQSEGLATSQLLASGEREWRLTAQGHELLDPRLKPPGPRGDDQRKVDVR